MENPIVITPNAVHMLVKIRQACFADNGVSLRVTGCGSIAAAHIIDDLITNVLALETEYRRVSIDLKAEREENAEYREMLGDYTVDELNDDEKEKLRALVAEWQKADREEESNEN